MTSETHELINKLFKEYMNTYDETSAWKFNLDCVLKPALLEFMENLLIKNIVHVNKKKPKKKRTPTLANVKDVLAKSKSEGNILNYS